MTVKLVFIHPAYDHCTVAEAATGKRDGHNHAASVSYSINAPIHFSSVGFLVWQKAQSKRQRSLNTRLQLRKPIILLKCETQCIDVTISHFRETSKHAREGAAVISRSTWMWNPIFSSLVELQQQWSSSMASSSAVFLPFMDGRTLASAKSNKGNPTVKYKSGMDQRSPIGPAQGKVAAVQSEHTASKTEHHRLLEEEFSERISFCCYMQLCFW